jgi:anti-sigma B factor antagonist
MGSGLLFDVRVESRNGVARLAVFGELDLATAPTLRDELVGAERDGVRDIMLDLRDATFVDSEGLNVIIRAWQRAQLNGHRFVVVGASRATQRLCYITGTEFVLDDSIATDIHDEFAKVDTGTRAIGETKARATPRRSS